MAMSKKSLWIIIGSVLLIALVAAAVYQSKNRKTGEEVELEAVEKRDIVESISASGKIFPEKEVKISSDVSGEIIELTVAEGDSVKVGQILVRIDPDAFQSAVARGKATLNDSKSQLAVNEANLESSKAQKAQIQAQYDNAVNIHERNKTLYKNGAISEADFEASQANVDQLKANLSSAEANIAAARKNIEGASYRVKSAKASLDELMTNLDRTTITAPIDGVVSQLNVEAGERVVGTIQMTGTEIMRIANMNAMEVQVEVSENDILNVDLGDKSIIEIDAFGERKFTGVVTEIASSAMNLGATGQVVLTSDQVTNFVVKIRIDVASYEDLTKSNKGRSPFRPGMTASVDIETDERKGVLSLPIQAVTAKEAEDKDDEFYEVVFVQSADTVIMKTVTTGIQDDEYIEILTGLEEGEVAVVGPYSAVAKKLEQGDKIYKKEEDDEEDDD
jgi:HlyD family secretion protein